MFGKENTVPGCIDRDWYEGSEVAILVLWWDFRENSTEVLHSSWDFWAHLRRNRGQQNKQTEKAT